MFVLANYEKEVRNYMNIKDLEPAKAVEHLVVNLRVMKDFYPISSEMNFRDLGQQWNNLPSDDRLTAKDQELQTANFQLSQQAQNATLIGALRPFPQPAYITCSPYTAQNGFGCGCNCA